MKSLYQTATEEVRNWIARENLSPGTRLPASKALAARLHLTPAMALRACQILIAEGQLRRDGYKLTVARAGESLPVPHGPVYILSYHERFLRVVSRTLANWGVNHRVLELSWRKNANADSILTKIYGENPGGVILWTPNWQKSTELILEKSAIPTIICADGVDGLTKPTAQTDIARGAEKALRYLQRLGHRNIAHVWDASHDHAPARELANCYRAACIKLKLGRSSSFIWKAYADDEVIELIREGLRENPEVTALFCEDRLGVMVTEAFAVPEELSVMAFGVFRGALESRPPLTTVALPDSDSIPLWACTEMMAQLRAVQEGKPGRPAVHAFFVPELVVRGSTRAIAFPKIAPEISNPPGAMKSNPVSTWRKVYPFLIRNQPEQWRQLDLSKLANHSLTRRHGWLGGEPLEHFPPGLRSIHGVPFKVIDEEKNQGRAVVTFRSPHSHSAGSEPLPTQAKIRIGTPVRALYFLHGCSYAKRIPFARYIIRYRRGDSLTVPLIPLGPTGRNESQKFGFLKPNIQDWWPGYGQKDFPHAHRVIVFNPSDPASYQRLLYSLEWINPRPEEEVRSIEVRVDPEAGPGLAIVAVTAFL